MNLFNHQRDFLKNSFNKGLLVWGTGTGKTATSLAWAEKVNPSNRRVLIICPKSLKENWARSVKKFNFKCSFSILSKEEFKKEFTNKTVVKEKFATVIIDEAHFFSGMKSNLSKSLIKYLHTNKIENVLGLTATPYLSSPLNIYTLGRIIGKTGWQWSYPYFMQEYFYSVNMGGRMIPVIRTNAPEMIADKVREIANIVKLEECIDVPDHVHETEYFELTDQQSKAIKAIKDIQHIVRWTKSHQISGGTLKGDEYNPDKFYNCHKLDRLLDLVEENKKLIIVCRYNNEVDNIADIIKSKKTFIINGSVKDKQAVLDEANNCSECVLVVNASCAEGWEAPTFDTIVFYSLDFSLKNYIQMKGRIQRINAIQKCTYVHLVTNGIDQDVYDCVVEKKQDFQINIYKK